MFIAGVSEIVDPPITDLWTIPGEEQMLAEFQENDRTEFTMSEPVFHHHRLQVEDFLSAVVDGRPPLVTGTDGRAAVALFEAIYRANEAGIAQRLIGPQAG